jgi:hypothetical protein
LAGCGGKSTAGTVRLGNGDRMSLDLPSSEQPKPDDIRGAVSGVVVDDAIFPVANATVTVRDRDWKDTSDANGRFSFPEEPPGLYTLVVHADGHADGLATVNIHSGEVAKAIVLVARVPRAEPYHTTWAFDKARTVDNYADGITDDLVPFDSPPATVVVESVWDPLTSIDSNVLGYNVTGEKHHDHGRAGDGPNPLRLQFDAGDLPRDEYALHVHVMPSNIALPIEVRGKTLVTLFYVSPAPDGWSLAAGDS